MIDQFIVANGTAVVGPLMVSIQVVRDSPYRALFTVHAWIGVTKIGSWPWDMSVSPTVRPRIAKEIHAALVLTNAPEIRRCLASTLDQVDAWEDLRPEREPSTLDQLVSGLRGKTGTVSAHSLHEHVTACTHPGRSIAKLMAKQSNREEIARRIGVSQVEYRSGRDASPAGPVIEITS